MGIIGKTMNRIIFILSIFAFIASSCGQRPNKQANTENYEESIRQTIMDDLKLCQDTLVDKCFDDFIYKFTCDKEFQLTRNRVDLDLSKLYECHAVYDYAFYFFNSFNIPDKEFEIDLTNEKYLSILNPTENKKTTLSFKKIGGRWFLTEIKTIKFDFNNVVDFEAFLYQFSIDSVFRKEHIKFPLKYEYADYENDYETKTDYLTEENVFKYDFFSKSNLIFFHSNKISNEKRILIFLRGIDNGWNTLYYFNKFNDTWKLIEESDYST